MKYLLILIVSMIALTGISEIKATEWDNRI